jgi:hypothetical protein
MLAATLGTASADDVARAECVSLGQLLELPTRFVETGRGYMPRRRDEPGTPGLDDVVQVSDGICTCHNVPALERDRGKRSGLENWSCSTVKH